MKKISSRELASGKVPKMLAAFPRWMAIPIRCRSSETFLNPETYPHSSVQDLSKTCPLLRQQSWTLRKSDENSITASEMKFMLRTAGYTKWDNKRNEDILQELGMELVLQYIHQYQDNWLHHVKRMPRTRISERS
ncbi:hypothetical protein ANN_15906 [Periplaneta americana]|uniref:Uncharacterized protein n=1 Tax=Periplaneta americana TaxID=6978 RepID=A0ABQ8SIS1_PERAM|nr:hypothetical protein ANN_15906 [Periplaneta americana]